MLIISTLTTTYYLIPSITLTVVTIVNNSIKVMSLSKMRFYILPYPLPLNYLIIVSILPLIFFINLPIMHPSPLSLPISPTSQPYLNIFIITVSIHKYMSSSCSSVNYYSVFLPLPNPRSPLSSLSTLHHNPRRPPPYSLITQISLQVVAP